MMFAPRGSGDTSQTPHKPLPQDIGDVHEPAAPWQCWAVVKRLHGREIPPRQCAQRRRGARRKGDAVPYCCHGHKGLEDAARELAEGKK